MGIEGCCTVMHCLLTMANLTEEMESSSALPRAEPAPLVIP